MFERVLAGSRYLLLLAVISVFLGAITLLVYATFVTFVGVTEVIGVAVTSPQVLTDSKAAKAMTIELINMVDLFLLAVVLYITAVGIYQLFIGKLQLPGALVIKSLEELKEKLVGVVVVVLGVMFLGELGDATFAQEGKPNIVELGVGIAVVIAALTWFMSRQSKHDREAPAAHGAGGTAGSPATAAVAPVTDHPDDGSALP